MRVACQQPIGLIPAGRVFGRLDLAVHAEEDAVAVIERQRQQHSDGRSAEPFDARRRKLQLANSVNDLIRTKPEQLGVHKTQERCPFAGVSHASIERQVRIEPLHEARGQRMR